jgi:hypothetical protein
MGVAGEWESLENGRRWRMVIAGEWEALWHQKSAYTRKRETKSPETGRRQRKVVSREK